MKILKLFVASLLCAGACICSASEGMQNYFASDGGYVTGTAGWTFQPLTNITVTSLGAFSYALDTQSPITIALWDYTGTMLASNSVTSTSLLLNQTRYESITPITLTAGLSYTIGAYTPSGTLILVAEAPGNGGSATMSPEIQLGTAVTAVNTFAFPNEPQGGPGAAFLVPNFQFDVVPEPAMGSIALLAGGTLFVRRKMKKA